MGIPLILLIDIHTKRSGQSNAVRYPIASFCRLDPPPSLPFCSPSTNNVFAHLSVTFTKSNSVCLLNSCSPLNVAAF